MGNHDDSLVVGLTAADVAWPIVLALCVVLMVFPFVFLIAAKWGEDPDAPPD